MWTFAIWLAVAAVIGAVLGALAFALMVVAKRADENAARRALWTAHDFKATR
jgi:hypothetical protein